MIVVGVMKWNRWINCELMLRKMLILGRLKVWISRFVEVLIWFMVILFCWISLEMMLK